MGRIAARLRSLFIPADDAAGGNRLDRLERKLAEAAAADARIEARIETLHQDLVALRTLVKARDDRAQEKLRAGFSSAVNLLSILPHLRLEGMIPAYPHQGFEITGELAAFIYHLIRRRRPKLIMELGSGSSTVLLAASARANGIGRVISVEHDAQHRRLTAQLLAETELSDRVTLVEAPLVEQRFGEHLLHWYDLAPLLAALPEKIDLVFVDGPPGKMQALSRYPALPALMPHLSAHAVLMVDDAGREDESRMLDLWRALPGATFAAESLDFLPRAPVLLTMGASEASVSELHPLRPDSADQSGDQHPAADRRSAG